MLLFYLPLIETEQDRDKFAYIYNEYLDWMLHIAYYFLRNEADAEDAVHEIFLDIISSDCSIPIDDKNATKSYLFICIRNRTARILKERDKIKAVNFEDYHNVASNYCVEDEVISNDDNERLMVYIDNMSKIYKDVLSLYFVYDKSLKEISFILKEPLKTVETRFRRGKMLLKEKFKDLDI